MKILPRRFTAETRKFAETRKHLRTSLTTANVSRIAKFENEFLRHDLARGDESATIRFGGARQCPFPGGGYERAAGNRISGRDRSDGVRRASAKCLSLSLSLSFILPSFLPYHYHDSHHDESVPRLCHQITVLLRYSRIERTAH